MDTKAEFEKWFLSIGGSVSTTADEKYRTDRARMAWWAWKASRAAIEIDLPEGTGWASDPYNHGRNAGINQCAESVKFHGIRIKGKTE